MKVEQSRSSDSFGERTLVPFARMAELEIDSTQFAQFKIAAIEHAQSALRLEPGVLALHAVAKRDDPGHVLMFEVYADREANKSLLQAPHFLKFQTTTDAMIVARKVVDTVPVILASKPQLTSSPLVRIAELEIDRAQLDAYKVAVMEEIETSIRVEPGVLAIYSVALQEAPTHLRFFEIYADDNAYRQHLESPHFKKYVDATKTMIMTKKLLETDPVVLGAKPR